MSEYVLEMDNIVKEFPGVRALKGVQLHVRPGTVHALMGENGAGKSTLMKCLFGIYKQDGGEIRIDGELLTRKRQDLKRKVSVITQEYSMRQDMDMDEIMEYQGRLYFMPVKQIRARTEELFAFAGLTEHRRKTIRKLSGGMKRKLMVCRALLTEPEILLLDEPTAALDPEAEAEVYTRFNDIVEDKTAIYISHRLSSCRFCDEIAVFRPRSGGPAGEARRSAGRLRREVPDPVGRPGPVLSKEERRGAVIFSLLSPIKMQAPRCVLTARRGACGLSRRRRGL